MSQCLSPRLFKLYLFKLFHDFMKTVFRLITSFLPLLHVCAWYVKMPLKPINVFLWTLAVAAARMTIMNQT